MKIKLYLMVCFGVILINFFSCRNDFASRRAGFDYIRIPFIKPYEALRLNGSKEWQMNLYKSALNSSVVNIKKVYVENGVISLYSDSTLLDGQRVNKAWFIVIPGKKVEIGFRDENDYIEYLNNIGIINRPLLVDINEVNNYFNNHYPINWASLR